MLDAARDQGIEFDLTGFELARGEEQTRARASWKGGSKASASPAFRSLPKTVFEGYRQLDSHHCEVLAIVKDGVGVPHAIAGDSVEIVLDHTCSTPTPAARWAIPDGFTPTTTTS
jgi:alanyl-tRNA synthetase